MKHLMLFFVLLIFNYAFSIASVRYVSHSGSNTPPYLTWETAADSIMSAINVSSFGDTIYVANGVYEEQVVMIPGLSLIGAGMDSCVIDTRALVNSNGFISVDVSDSCLFQGFQILVYSNTTKGYGIAVRGESLIAENKIKTSWYGMYSGWTGIKNPLIFHNIIENISVGIEIFNSSPLIRNNTITTDPNSQSTIVAGIDIEAYDFTYTPVIDSNYMLLNGAGAYGIYKSYGARPIITNNVLILNPASGMVFSTSDSVKVYNNLIYGRGSGILNNFVLTMIARNNYISGDIGTGIRLSPDGDIAENNVVTDADIGISKKVIRHLIGL